MKAHIITHPYFKNKPVTIFEFKGEYAVLYQMGEGKDFSLWFTGCDHTKPNKPEKFLDECADGKHDTAGTGVLGTYHDCLSYLTE